MKGIVKKSSPESKERFVNLGNKDQAWKSAERLADEVPLGTEDRHIVRAVELEGVRGIEGAAPLFEFLMGIGGPKSLLQGFQIKDTGLVLAFAMQFLNAADPGTVPPMQSKFMNIASILFTL